MNRGYVYTVVFTFVLTAVFTAVLAITQAAYAPVISRNELNAERAAILNVLGIQPEEGQDVDEVFAVQVTSQSLNEVPIYTSYSTDNGIASYAFPLNGQGLWGSIKGYIGVSADFTTLLGLEFTEQNETPGLGGRIDEAWFKDQFRGLDLVPGKHIEYGEGLDAITGATSSSNAVLRILNETIDDIMPLREVTANAHD